MKLTGRAAQFGRGIAQDVATKMLDQFASCLEEEITGSPEEGASAAAEPTGEENGSRDGAKQGEAPAAAVGGTAGRIISSEDPGVMAGGTVEGAVVAGSSEASEGAPTTEPEQPSPPQQAPRQEREEPEAFDIGAASQEAILKRATPVLVGAGVLVVLIWLLRRRR